jgi:hypothetical protein
MNSNLDLRDGYLSSARARSESRLLRRGTRSAVLILIGRLEARMRGSEKDDRYKQKRERRSSKLYLWGDEMN